ncbi:MAG: acylphosphatase [Gemmataceae bacterium]
MNIAKQVRYSGRVQGVGFRYTALHVAQRFAVTGYVRNLPGGDVELVAEGAADQVDAFLTALAQRLARNIDKITVREETPHGCHGFEIRY